MDRRHRVLRELLGNREGEGNGFLREETVPFLEKSSFKNQATQY